MDKQLEKAIRERILVIDGAMGTVLQRHPQELEDIRGNFDCLNLSHPDIIRGIHEEYIAAGADIIETNSFSANRISQAEYTCGDKAREMAFAAASIARQAADDALTKHGRKVWVAGSVGPTGKSLTLASDISRPAFRAVSFDDMVEAYSEQISALAEGGADIILVETCFDALNVKAAIYAAGKVAPELPMMISVAVSDMSGRTLTGQTLEAFYTAVKHAPLLSFGLNCSFGASALEPFAQAIEPSVECAFSLYPNAGLPNELGQYDESPQTMAEALGKMARRGMLNIVGGCCGTTPEHIKAIAEAVNGISPRFFEAAGAYDKEKKIGKACCLTVSGLECAVIDRERSLFTNIGERTNVAGSRKFARLIASGAYDEALQIAAGQIDGGASIIDINMDDAMLDPQVEMEKFLRYISNDPSVAKAALMIDSSHFPAIVAALKNAQGKCIVNSISLKEGEEIFLQRAMEIKALGAAVVVMAFDEQGQATSFERKTAICERAYRLLVDKAGFNPCDIIFDVNVLSVGTGIAEHARYGVDFIEAVRWIKANLPGALTSGGISNLSFAFRGNNTVREAMHSAFLYHASAAGLDMGIVNPSMLQVYDEIDPQLLHAVEDVILDRCEDATERLAELAQEIALKAAQDKAAAAAGGAAATHEGATSANAKASSVEKRLEEALVKGRGESLEADVKEALDKLGTPVAVIEGPLMAGMEKVGKMFGEGKMFLPQVVKSAKTMKDAVDVLQPYMQGESSNTGEGGTTSRRPVIVLATVKGDVHDIGKNITSIVLSCNGFDVKDLGVMVPAETILEQAAISGADIIGVSGLITPSLSRMEELCRMMEEKDMKVPLFVGGATTSALHTAVKLSPLYGHVFHGTDASSTAVMAKKYMMDPAAFEEAAHEEQKRIRELYQLKKQGQKVPETTEDKVFSKEQLEKDFLCGKHFSDISAREIDIDELMPLFDWNMFYAIWGIKAAAISKGDEAAITQAAALKQQAMAMVEQMKAQKSCMVTIAARFLDCQSEGDDIVSEPKRWPMLRQERSTEGHTCTSLADFIVPSGYGLSSQMGLFAISARHIHTASCQCGCESDSYSSMLERSVRLTLAEAASTWLDNVLETQIPKERSDVRIAKPAAGYSSCPDHTLKRDILPLLPEGEKLGISFTESYAMIPDASICGFIFAHPQAGYPQISHISQQALDKYALRRGLTADEVRTFLSHLA